MAGERRSLIHEGIHMTASRSHGLSFVEMIRFLRDSSMFRLFRFIAILLTHSSFDFFDRQVSELVEALVKQCHDLANSEKGFSFEGFLKYW